MYGWIWRHLPGPVWLRILEAVLLVAAAVAALVVWVFPWVNGYLEPGDVVVGQ